MGLDQRVRVRGLWPQRWRERGWGGWAEAASGRQVPCGLPVCHRLPRGRGLSGANEEGAEVQDWWTRGFTWPRHEGGRDTVPLLDLMKLRGSIFTIFLAMTELGARM